MFLPLGAGGESGGQGGSGAEGRDWKPKAQWVVVEGMPGRS